ncbi:hypothetical protein [Ciceribacter thiooxidans]|nr:hypothetical protein [Ciceribacter thiooxidans]
MLAAEETAHDDFRRCMAVKAGRPRTFITQCKPHQETISMTDKNKPPSPPPPRPPRVGVDDSSGKTQDITRGVGNRPPPPRKEK